MKKFLDRLCDLFLVNILWLIFSIPVLTVGAATSGAYYVTFKLVDGEDISIPKTFLKGFKDNFKQGTVMWFLTAPLFYVLYLMWHGIIESGDYNIIIMGGAFVLTLIAISAVIYAFPMIARYKNALLIIIRNSCMVFLQYFFKSLKLIAIVAVEVLILCLSRWTLLAGLLIIPEVIIYTISRTAKEIFLEIEKS